MFALFSLLSPFGFPGGIIGEEHACQCRRHKRHGFDIWVRKMPWTWYWQPTPVFLPGESHGQGSLASYSPWRCKESDMAERQHTHGWSVYQREDSLWDQQVRGYLAPPLAQSLDALTRSRQCRSVGRQSTWSSWEVLIPHQHQKGSTVLLWPHARETYTHLRHGI